MIHANRPNHLDRIIQKRVIKKEKKTFYFLYFLFFPLLFCSIFVSLGCCFTVSVKQLLVKPIICNFKALNVIFCQHFENYTAFIVYQLNVLYTIRLNSDINKQHLFEQNLTSSQWHQPILTVYVSMPFHDLFACLTLYCAPSVPVGKTLVVLTSLPLAKEP